MLCCREEDLKGPLFDIDAPLQTPLKNYPIVTLTIYGKAGRFIYPSYIWVDTPTCDVTI